MKSIKLATAALLIVGMSATASYSIGFTIVKDPWSILETHSGFAGTIQDLNLIHDKVTRHYQYAMYRDTWTNPLTILDQQSRIASLNVRPQEVGWGTGGVLEQKMPNIASDMDQIQRTIETGSGSGSIRNNVAEIYGDPTTGGVERTYRDVSESYVQIGRTNQAIQENLKNAADTKAKLENCDKCTQSDKDRLTTQLNYYQTMAAQYSAQSSNYHSLIAGNNALMQAQRVNEENQNRWRERAQAGALIGVTRVGVGPLSSKSRQD